uniref:Uncharacterized protein n=1 Tax=Nymphaea colorata TaxID=210225 RepID=A0A5K1EGZ1_9MAGN
MRFVRVKSHPSEKFVLFEQKFFPCYGFENLILNFGYHVHYCRFLI